MWFSRQRTFALVAVLIAVTGLGVAGTVLTNQELSPPVAGAQTGDDGTLGFREVAAERGFVYTASDDRSSTMGNSRGGVFVTDFDNDGLPDLLATGGEHAVLFENTGGEFERSDALPGTVRPSGALFFDHDNDGWEDLLVFELGRSPTFFENSGGEFERRDVGFDRNLTVVSTATTLDYDDDGCLDVFVGQTGDWRNQLAWHNATGEPYDEPGSRGGANGAADLLYAGDCSGFEHVPDAGFSGTYWSIATTAADFDGDGHTDIHVANDFHHDVVYRNLGDGTFETRLVPNTNRHGMSSDVADLTGDGLLDVFVTNIHFDKGVWQVATSKHLNNDGNSLLVGQPNGTFTSKEEEYGVADGGWGWAAGIVDFDNDGYLDITHATQLYLEYNEYGADKLSDPITPPPRLWLGTDGPFENVYEPDVGLGPVDGRGLVHFDFDRDGDQDIAVADVNASDRYDLFENTIDGDNAWLQVELEGDNRPILGSEVCVVTGNRTRCQLANAKADFLSQDTRTLHFGLGNATSATLRVTWPDGSTDAVKDIAIDRRVVVAPGGQVSDATVDANG